MDEPHPPGFFTVQCPQCPFQMVPINGLSSPKIRWRCVSCGYQVG